MMQDERLLLIRDLLPKAEERVRKAAMPDSLTEKILQGWFGSDAQYLFLRKAREMAWRWEIG